MTRPALQIALTMCLCVGSVAFGDLITLSNGEVLSGDIYTLSDGAMIFQTDLAGQIILPVERVSEVESPRLLRLTLADGSTLTGTLTTVEGNVCVRPSTGDKIQSIVLADVTAFESVPQKEDLRARGEEFSTLRGSVEAGGLWRNGERGYSGPFARLTLRSENRHGSVHSKTLLSHLDTHSFPDFLLHETEWRLGEPGRLQPLISLELERDVDKALELGADLSMGVGKSLYESERAGLYGSVGLAASGRHFDDGWYVDVADTEDGWRWSAENLFRRHSDSELDLNMRLKLNHSLQVFDNGTFTENLTLWPSLTSMSELRARSESSFYWGVSSSLRLRVDLMVDYDARIRYEELQNWRTTVGASVLWRF